VAFHARLEGAFAKQGTAIAVRLLVIDKCAGSINTTVVNWATVADLVPFLSKVPPRRRVATELAPLGTPPVSPAKITSTLLGGFRSAAPRFPPANCSSDATGAIHRNLEAALGASGVSDAGCPNLGCLTNHVSQARNDVTVPHRHESG
jgi:hypothetical protein